MTISVDEDLLAIDYNHLESQYCLCRKTKNFGELFCRECLKFMPAHELAQLNAIRPGTGIASGAVRLHSKVERARKGWTS